MESAKINEALSILEGVDDADFAGFMDEYEMCDDANELLLEAWWKMPATKAELIAYLLGEDLPHQSAAKSERRMRCNVCGHIFCYTDEDLRKNHIYSHFSAFNAVGALFSQTIMHEHHLMGQANRYEDKIIDYSRCPACHSNNISEIQESKAMPQPSIAPEPVFSPVEEIKKYKELLDLEIITQEEFDAKKKQILGL